MKESNKIDCVNSGKFDEAVAVTMDESEKSPTNRRFFEVTLSDF